MANSLYFTAANLVMTSKDAGKEPLEFQMNQWTFDNVVDEVAMFSPTQLVLAGDVDAEPVPEGYAAKLLDIPVRINEGVGDTQIVLVEKKQGLDKPQPFVVRL